jgi:protein transport protein SEC31
MKLKEIHRTSTFAWSPTASLPQLATGTVAGALDASFSDDSLLEIWTPNLLDRAEYDLGSDGYPRPSASVSVDARYVLSFLPPVDRADDDAQVQPTRLGWC